MILITGGSGFIGTNLSKRFNEAGRRFINYDIRPSPLFSDHHTTLDILDYNKLRDLKNCDTIVHLAAEHRDDVKPKSKYEQTNVLGTANVVAAARESGVNRIIFTSTVAVYGFAKPGTGEDGAINPFNEYGRTKYEAEKVLEEWHAEDPDARSLTIVRPTVVFGPGNRGNVFNLLNTIHSGRFLMIGDGTNRKSMAYVANVAAFLDWATQQPAGFRRYNYVDKPDLNMNDLASLVRKRLKGKEGAGPRIPLWLGSTIGVCCDGAAKITGKRFPISKIRVKKFTSTTSFASAVHHLSDFEPVASLESGLEETLTHEFVAPDPAAPVFYTE
ncbi:MAG: NAD(P)-dependent oxidoreductase [Pseudomonadota bacterium]